MELIKKYFPGLSADQLEKFSRLHDLYLEWNARVNVVSRRDIEHLYEKHVLHSLAIAKFIFFNSGTSVLDLGTGGGFPGIPLSIFFTQANFHLVDSIGKKIKVVQAITEELDLKNVSSQKIRVEELRGKYDFIVSRAVASMKTMYDWSEDLIAKENKNKISKGWIFLKGGDLKNEIRELGKPVVQIPISDYFEEEFFKEKFIISFQ